MRRIHLPKWYLRWLLKKNQLFLNIGAAKLSQKEVHRWSTNVHKYHQPPLDLKTWPSRKQKKYSKPKHWRSIFVDHVRPRAVLPSSRTRSTDTIPTLQPVSAVHGKSMFWSIGDLNNENRWSSTGKNADQTVQYLQWTRVKCLTAHQYIWIRNELREQSDFQTGFGKLCLPEPLIS